MRNHRLVAEILESGSIVAFCPGCKGGLSTFEFRQEKTPSFGAIERVENHKTWNEAKASYRLFRCAGCGAGAVAKIVFGGQSNYPGTFRELIWFFPEVRERLRIPGSVPNGIASEFREGEDCMGHNNLRAAAGMFRSVLDKTMRSNGYKNEGNLKAQIEAAAKDGVITESRKLRAHNEIRVLGNDVLHEEWQPIPREDVEASRHYCQRILEDFYDDRPSVIALLRLAKRVADDDKPAVVTS